MAMSGTPSPRVEFRMDPRLKREVEEAAALLGTTFTAFATQALVERAREVRLTHSMTTLAGEAANEFARLIAEAPEPTEALQSTLADRKIEV